MINIYINMMMERPVKYALTGRSQPSTPNWIHLKRAMLNDYELIVVTEGVVFISNGEREYEVKRGDYVIFPPGSPQYGTRPSMCCFYWLHFTCHNELVKIYTASANLFDFPYRIVLPAFGTIKNLDKIIILMKQLQDSIRSYNNIMQNDYMASSVICELNNQMSERIPGMLALKHQQMYNDILDYVKWFKYTDVRVADIANHFGYNVKYFSHLFRNIAGMSLKQYMLSEKMERAKFMLTDTNDHIDKIANQLGFADSHNFMKFFKKKSGVTPSEYRNTYFKRMQYFL